MNASDITEIAISIVDICNKTTSGNVSHNIATIKHQALYLQSIAEKSPMLCITTNDSAEYRTKQKPQFVRLTTVDYIMEKRLPLGKFYSFDMIQNHFIAIDNTSGDAVTQNFDSEVETLVWLTTEREPVVVEEEQKAVTFEIQRR
jgi:hypothetical protein